MGYSGQIPGTMANALASDSQSLEALRLQAQKAPDKALKQAAKQFETVFLNMMLKAMREATPQDGAFDSEQTRMFTSMLDQQLAQGMGQRGVGLADIMVRQLSRNLPAAAPSADAGAPASATATATAQSAHANAAMSRVPAAVPARAAPVAASAVQRVLPSAYSANFQQDFVQRMLPYAQQASRETGVPAHLLLGQAALESGWGRRSIRNADGSDSHNLFGIKAGANWDGKVAAVKTTEYHHGVASKPTERFRAYASYADAFRDYAHLMSSNPRYAGVLQQDDALGFARALQESGYATDPKYADKLASVIGSVRAIV
jgi:flagellar protein FlgJ